MSETNLKSMSELVSLCKRRGFVFQSSEIYGGIGSCWDYGPLGIELKNNLKQSWWKNMTLRDDVVGLDASILMHPLVWKASGHVDTFSDPLVDCKNCKQRFRADHIDLKKPCPNCGTRDSLTEPREFNLMFKTQMGPVEDASNMVYLRPETAQGIFVNFLNVQTTMRKKVPFGIAQIGKAFRNEITPGNFIFRTREFEQMEMQYFIHKKDTKEKYDMWKDIRMKWYIENGIPENKLAWYKHEKLAHYASDAYDVEYDFSCFGGFEEVEGIHARGDWDLSQHSKFSGVDLSYYDEETKERFVPHIVETSAGLGRIMLMFLDYGYTEDNLGGEKRVFLKLPKKLAPIKIAVFPLLKNKPILVSKAKEVYDLLRKDFMCEFDDNGNIGKRYRRQDEIGTPYCVTVDFETIEKDSMVTVRDRDTGNQERIKIEKLSEFFKSKF